MTRREIFDVFAQHRVTVPDAAYQQDEAVERAYAAWYAKGYPTGAVIEIEGRGDKIKVWEAWEITPCQAHAVIGCMLCRYGPGA